MTEKEICKNEICEFVLFKKGVKMTDLIEIFSDVTMTITSLVKELVEEGRLLFIDYTIRGVDSTDGFLLPSWTRIVITKNNRVGS